MVCFNKLINGQWRGSLTKWCENPSGSIHKCCALQVWLIVAVAEQTLVDVVGRPAACSFIFENQRDEMSNRSKKLEHLSKFCNLETGEFDKDAFADLDLLYQKGRRGHKLAQRIRCCDLCPGMNIGRVTECCPGWGNLNADVMFVGQSLYESDMYSQIPFISKMGVLIDAVLRLSRIDRHDCWWTNVVHCHPERNRASTEEEKENCWGYLAEELDIVQPRVVVSLGKDADWAVKKYMKERECEFKYLKYSHPASLMYSAPEAKPNYIIKMSLDIDKILGKVKK